jgi:Gamma-glutamyl cyclotransferase, AIG2-like
MFAPVWNQICTGRYATQPLTLQNLQRYCVVNESYPAVVPQAGGSVDGLVYLDVSESDQHRLNQFEGAEYVLRQTTANGLTVAFYEFIALNRLDKRPWSPTQFEREGLPAFLARHVGGFLVSGTRGSSDAVGD